MKPGIFVAVLVLILVAPFMAQGEGTREGVIHKTFQSDNPPVSIQAAKGDKTGVILNTAWATDNRMEEKTG
jgi:hypothetical protein